jgi:hypothetical protein
MQASTSEPPTSSALDDFLELSPCPYAQRASVLRCEPWADPKALPDRIGDVRQGLLDLGDVGHDLLALEIEQADLLKTPRDAAALVHVLLQGLRSRDAQCPKPLTEGIESPGWDFLHGGEKFFVSLFAPFYPHSHSRFSGQRSVAFILFQPERTFRRFGVSSQRPRREGLSQAVHRRFRRKGQEYDVGLNTRTPKALRFVKPLGADDPPIAWWRVPYQSGLG